MRQAVSDTGTVRLSQAGLLCARGHVDAVYEILEAASFEHLFTPVGVLPFGELSLNAVFKPNFAAMRRDKRFVEICARLGLCAYWAESGEWPDCVAEVAPFYDLKAEAVRALKSRPGSL
jgi:adenylate cyclase